MNKNGFTLVEILAVVVILALVGVLVSTNGFGAFNNISKKVELEDEKTILASANLIAKEVLDCDDSLDSDFVEDFYYVVTGDVVKDKTCSDIKNEGCHSLSLERMLEKNFISGSNLNKYLKKYKNDETKTEYITPKLCVGDDRIVINPSKTVEEPESEEEIIVNDKSLNLYVLSNAQVRDNIYANIIDGKYQSNDKYLELKYNMIDLYSEVKENSIKKTISVKVNDDAVYVNNAKSFQIYYNKLIADNFESFKNVIKDNFDILQRKLSYTNGDKETLYRTIVPSKTELISNVYGVKYFKFTYSEDISEETKKLLKTQKNYIYVDNDDIKNENIVYNGNTKFNNTDLQVTDGTFAILNEVNVDIDQDIALMQNKYYVKKYPSNALELFDEKNNYGVLDVSYSDACNNAGIDNSCRLYEINDNNIKDILNKKINDNEIKVGVNNIGIDISLTYIEGKVDVNLEYIDIFTDDYMDLPNNSYYFSTLSNRTMYDLIFNKKYDNTICLDEYKYDSGIDRLKYNTSFCNTSSGNQNELKKLLDDFVNNVSNYKTNKEMRDNLIKLQLNIVNNFIDKPFVRKDGSYQEIPSSDYDVYYDYSEHAIYYILDLSKSKNFKYNPLNVRNAIYYNGKCDNNTSSWYCDEYIKTKIINQYSNKDKLVIWRARIEIDQFDPPYYLSHTVDLTYDENSRNYYFPHLDNFKSFSYDILLDSAYQKPNDSSENIGITVDSTPFLKALENYLQNGDDCRYCTMENDYCSSYYNGKRVYAPYVYYQSGGSYIFTISHFPYTDFLRTNVFSTNLNIIPYVRESVPHYYYDDYFTITDTNYERVSNSDSSDSYYKVGYNSSGNEVLREEISEGKYYEKTGAAPDGGR